MSYSFPHPLDYNKQFFLEFAYDAGRRVLRGNIGARFNSSGKFEQHLCEQSLQIQINELLVRLEKNANGVYGFSIAVTTSPANMHILLDGEIYGNYQITLQSIEGKVTNQLTVFETRSIAQYQAKPYSRVGQEHMILSVTDTHTHISAQGSYRSLVQKHGGSLYYPVRLLREFDIAIPENAELVLIDRIRFPPLDKGSDIPAIEEGIALAKLSPESRDRLLELMAVPVDEIYFGFSKLELTCYQLRAPFKKFIPLMLEEIAEEGERHGLKYLEISVSGMNKDFLLMAEKLEEKFDIKMRFLYSIPRNLPKEMIHDHIEHLKVLAQSPYLVGADIIGYEASKNAEIKDELEGLFKWAGANNQGAPLLTLCILCYG